MKPEELLGVDDWRKFYHKEDKYHFIGYLVMDMIEESYYDMEGKPTPKLEALEKLFTNAYAVKEYKEEQQKKYPGCNSSYKAGKGGRVWYVTVLCSSLSLSLSFNVQLACRF